MSDLTTKYQNKMPGVYIEELSAGSNPIVGVGTSTAAFIGLVNSTQYYNDPQLITSWNEFVETYKEDKKEDNDKPIRYSPFKDGYYLPYAVYCFFNEGGTRCYVVNLDCPVEAYIYNKIPPVAPPLEESALSHVPEISPMLVDSESVTLADTALSKTTFQGIGLPSVFVRITSSAYQDPLSVKLEGSEGNYTLTVKAGACTEDADCTGGYICTDAQCTTDPITITSGSDGFVLLDGVPEVQYNFLAKTTPDTSDTTFHDLPNIAASCPEETLALVFENLKKVDDINIIAFPDMVVGSDDYAKPYIQLGYEYCYARQYCFFIIDSLRDDNTLTKIKTSVSKIGNIPININGQESGVKTEELNKYSAVYFPWLEITNPSYSPYGDTRPTITVPPSGAIAGMYARTDANRGVWKAPAGLSDGRIYSAKDVDLKFSEKNYGDLNCHNINAIRNIKDTGGCVWGARTVVLFSDEDDCNAVQALQTEWKYINIRRLFNYIEESLYEGNQWVVFEPNGPELWSIVNRNITAFLTDQWKDGAFYGTTAEEAFFVKVDKDNNPPDLREQGFLIIDVGIAPIYPAEFVIIRITQKMLTE
jgi:hypothetical protein